MYKIGELKFKDHVSYTEMMTVAMQYAKNAMDGEAEGFVAHDFAYICALLYVFAEVGEAQLEGDVVMHDVYSVGFRPYIEQMRERTPMGRGYFDGFVDMLDRADEAAGKRQPIDTLLDSLIRFADTASEFMQAGGGGVSGMEEVLKTIREFAGNEGEATPTH